jgi:glycine dehydrogenase subunit 2
MRLLFEKSRTGLKAIELPRSEVPAQTGLAPELLRESCELPELSEAEIIRHYTGLSHRSIGVDNVFYPLGSCTMKYNPKINEKLARLPGFTESHPLCPTEDMEGNLELIWNLEHALCEITGMNAFTLQPAAGAHGELTGLLIIKAYFQHKKQKRTIIITPDSSHGTNPASAAMCGFKTVSLKSNESGMINLEELEKVMDENVAGLMLTNPNTLGIFEQDICKITEIVHKKGGLVYGDGANANALLGISKFKTMGFDLIHLNLHKTFSTPHGGGGPGAGPLGVTTSLKEYLPAPLIIKKGGGFCFYTPTQSVGRVKSFYGNFSIFIRAYAYICALGPEGLKKVSETAVLNANYLRKKLEHEFHIPYNSLCKHEFVIDDSTLSHDVTTMDLAKRLLDYGFHPPTVYFPLIVKGALMIEPTETESMETLDTFAETLHTIKNETQHNPELVKSAPHTTPVTRLNEVLAARRPVLMFKKQG